MHETSSTIKLYKQHQGTTQQS